MTGGRILIVDDDAALRQSVARILEGEGYTVAEAADGLDALARLGEELPDAILLDVLMPRMNGKELLAALRKSDRTSAIPVVMMTGVSGMLPQQRTIDPDEIVEKPFDMDSLLNKLALAVCRARDLAPSSGPDPLPREE